MSDLHGVFEDLADDLQASLRDMGWETPMPVQERTIPLMREGGDLIVQALTGSGKTGAFGIPIIESVDLDLDATQALVMLPTRELALQVHDELTAIGKHRGVRVLAVYGGVGYGAQIEGLEEGAHVVVGTPGRILDHLGNRRMDLGDLQVLVLDEADEMLSLGFWPDMREIASYLPKERQSHLFSATIPEKVRSLARHFLTDETFVAVDMELSAPQKIEHFFYVCTASEKEALLARIIEYEDPESAIIFCNTKADVRYITRYLEKRGLDVDQISGDLTQQAREQAMGRIKAGQLRFLVATDVAARGIDISDLSHVISYSTSDSAETYVHRTGRTGRAGKSGVAISLVSGLDIGNFKQMQLMNKIKIVERKPPTEKDILDRMRERVQNKVGHELRHMDKSEIDLRVDRLIPMVEAMVGTKEGRRDLAAICAAYMNEHRPQTAPESSREPDEELSLASERRSPRRGDDPEAARGEDRDDRREERDDDRSRRPRRRRSRGRSGGGGGGGGRKR